MNTVKTRRQHYVPQAYLSAWRNENEQVWCLRNRKDAFQTNTQNIAQERDFYKIEPLNKFEVDLFKEFIRKDPVDVQNALLQHLKIYQTPIRNERTHMQLKDAILRLDLQDAAKKDIEITCNELDKLIEKMKNDTVEEYYAYLESESCRWIDAFRKNEVDNLHEVYENIIEFVCVQYFRTKRMRDALYQAIETVISHPRWNEQMKIPREEIHPARLVHLFAWRFQSASVVNLIYKKAHITLLHNTSNANLLTSDQPVINLKANYQNTCVKTKELIFYYPLSPRIALQINDIEKRDKKEIGMGEVQEFNKKMVEASYQWIFGQTKEDIMPYRE